MKDYNIDRDIGHSKGANGAYLSFPRNLVEAPEKKATTLYEVTGDPAYKLEAPTDEGWKRSWDDEKLSHYIQKLLEIEEGKESPHNWNEYVNRILGQVQLLVERSHEAGKSEAFSLVREIVKKMTHEEKGYWGTERLKIFGWNGALTEFITRLSTLEGK